jgi:hypothetical protein
VRKIGLKRQEDIEGERIEKDIERKNERGRRDLEEKRDNK